MRLVTTSKNEAIHLLQQYCELLEHDGLVQHVVGVSQQRLGESNDNAIPQIIRELSGPIGWRSVERYILRSIKVGPRGEDYHGRY